MKVKIIKNKIEEKYVNTTLVELRKIKNITYPAINLDESKIYEAYWKNVSKYANEQIKKECIPDYSLLEFIKALCEENQKQFDQIVTPFYERAIKLNKDIENINTNNTITPEEKYNILNGYFTAFKLLQEELDAIEVEDND